MLLSRVTLLIVLSVLYYHGSQQILDSLMGKWVVLVLNHISFQWAHRKLAYDWYIRKTWKNN